MNRIGRQAIQRAARMPQVRRAAVVALRDDDTLAWLLWHLCDRLAIDEASFERDCPRGLDRIAGFEHLAWLYSSNALNQRLSRLQFDEGAFLFDVVRQLGAPQVGEVGRFRGGTTFLLAAAGANVVTIDNNPAVAAGYDPELRRALTRFGLDGRVELVVADARSYVPAPASFDLAFLDADVKYESLRRYVELWLPALVSDGQLIIRGVSPADPRYPFLRARMTGLVRLIDELDGHHALVRRRETPPSFAVYGKRPTG